MDKFTLELFSIDVRKAANQDVKFNVREKTESDFFLCCMFSYLLLDRWS
jgi:hypothetical protein